MKRDNFPLNRPPVFDMACGHPAPASPGKRWLFPRLSVLFTLFMALILGCATPYGRLQRDTDVTRMFRTNSVPENFLYYVDGRSNMPYAIVGIDPQFRLVPHFWEPVTPNSDRFARMVGFIWPPDDWVRHTSGQGAYILDSKGNHVGIWYSMYPHTTIVVHADGRVAVFSPYLGDFDEDLAGTPR